MDSTIMVIGMWYAYVKYMLPCPVGIAVSKLSIATQSTMNGSPIKNMIALMTGLRADVVGL